MKTRAAPDRRLWVRVATGTVLQDLSPQQEYPS